MTLPIDPFRRKGLLTLMGNGRSGRILTTAKPRRCQNLRYHDRGGAAGEKAQNFHPTGDGCGGKSTSGDSQPIPFGSWLVARIVEVSFDFLSAIATCEDSDQYGTRAADGPNHLGWLH
jgi:hypothetical protein